jgi:hypothetical protein
VGLHAEKNRMKLRRHPGEELQIKRLTTDLSAYKKEKEKEKEKYPGKRGREIRERSGGGERDEREGGREMRERSGGG